MRHSTMLRTLEPPGQKTHAGGTALALGLAALCAACTGTSAPRAFDFGPSITHAVAVALDERGDFVSASGLRAVPGTLISEPLLGERVVVLGYDDATLPGPFTGALSDPARVAKDCAPRLPSATETLAVGEAVVPPLPSLSGSWLNEVCPVPPDALAVEDGDALGRCTLSVASFQHCRFTASLAPESCSARGVVEGRVQPDGSLCVNVKSGLEGCARGGSGPSLDCTAIQAGFNFALPGPAPFEVERRSIGEGRALRNPKTFDSDLGYPSDSIRLVRGVFEGWLADLALDTGTIALLDHDGDFIDASCRRVDGTKASTRAPDRLRLYREDDLSPAGSATIAPCAMRVLSTSDHQGWLVVHGGQEPSLSVLDRVGRVRRRVTLCPGIIPSVVAGAAISDAPADNSVAIVLGGMPIEPITIPAYFVRLSQAGEVRGACRDITGWWGDDPGNGAHWVMDLLHVEGASWAMTDAGIAGGWIFDGPRTSSAGPGAQSRAAGQRFTVHSGVDVHIDLGFLGLTSERFLLLARPGRLPALERQDPREIEQPLLVPHFISSAGVLMPIQLGLERVVSTLVKPLDRPPFVQGGLGAFLGPRLRAQPYEGDLGPGLPGRIVRDSMGRALIVMPWSSELLRVSISP